MTAGRRYTEVMALDKRKKSGSKVTFADIILSVLHGLFAKIYLKIVQAISAKSLSGI